MSTDSTTVVLVIGGGLGGLALAQLLLQASSSIKVLVFERDETRIHVNKVIVLVSIQQDWK